jgi:predicted signal transduction protein with EAL and GGDEF domain
VARLGGDEFAVVVHGGPAAGDAVARGLQDALRPPFWVEDVRMQVGGSFGIASGPATAAALPELLRCADVAMYEAKRTRTGVMTYTEELGHGMADRLRTVDELRTALVEGQLVVHLQPIVEPVGCRLQAVEALVRWQHPVRGLLSPAQLLPAAEQAGLLGPLTETVLDLALEAAAQWWPLLQAPVGVNLSAVSVADLDLPRKVQSALQRHGLPARALTLEIVEDTFMSDPARATSVLGQLRSLGVEVAIDDYGTGYSSLAYLKDLPADQLKIDRAFTDDLTTDGRVRAILQHTISLAHVLGLRVVVEGVEDAATLQVLRELRCDLVQGFHVARPGPLPQLMAHVLASAPDAVPA